MNMEVAEVEGDAILFYKENFEIEIDAILKQTETMFLKFHHHLKQYEQHRICNCGACSTATNLSLKFVVHQSEIGFTMVNNVKKPFGPGLVTVHRILKNQVRSPEYVLFTEIFFSAIENYQKIFNSPLKFYEGSEIYKTIGEVKYKYLDYTPLLTKVSEVDPPHLVNQSSNPVIYKGIIEKPMYVVYEFLSNLEYRMNWQKGIKDLIYEKNRVNRVGTKHVCVFSGSQVEFETITRKSENEKMIYGEKMENVFFNREINIYYILENKDKYTTVKIEMHFVPQSLMGRLILPLVKFQSKQALVKSFNSLKRYCESNSIPVT